MANVSTTVNEETQKQLADWVGDIVALESHIEEAMDHQIKLKSDNTELTSTLQRFHDTVRASKYRAQDYQKGIGSTGGNPIIKAGAAILGKAAGLIDKVRHDSISKSLRDDYSAFNMAAIAYTMLHTTAMAVGDARTQQFAGEGLKTYAGLVQDINRAIPLAVAIELKDNGDIPNVDTSVVDNCRAFIDSAWKSTSN
jgi:ferritin-like metal-binding protein YciE